MNAARHVSHRVSPRARVARKVVGRLLGRVRGGTVEVCDQLGSATFGAGVPAGIASPHHVRVAVHDLAVYERVLRGGSVALGESYADGSWDVDDLPGFLRLALRGLRPTHATRDRVHRAVSPLVDPVARLRRAGGDPGRDARAVRAHYDLGNEFFQRVLDDTMAYSCAIFEPPGIALADASRVKFERLARLLDVQRGDRLLEIGTGWGGFAVHVARHYGCRVTTTTVSQRQYEFALARVRDAGLDDRITVLDRDYRDLHGTFDKIVAVEMIEAVDWRDYGAFFQAMRKLLDGDGVLAMQAIVAPDASFDRLKRHTDFIKAAIFPGGCLPSVAALSAAARQHGGFALREHHDIGLHYAQTLRHWRANLARIAPELPAIGLDRRFARLWEFYFAYCEAGFDERYIGAEQLLYSPRVRAAAAARTGVRGDHESVAV